MLVNSRKFYAINCSFRKCKIKKEKCNQNPPKSAKKCKKKCKKDRKKKKPLCQKTCCELGFPVI